PYTDKSDVDEKVTSDDAQPGGEEQPRAGLEVDEASQFSPGAQAEPGTGSAEPGVSLVNEVDGVPVFQILEDDGTQPEAEAGSGQPLTDEQPQPADRSEQATVRSGDRIQPEGIPLGLDGCTAGPLVSHESGASGILTAGHCGVHRWTDRDGRYLGPTLIPEVEVEGNDVEIVRLDGDVVPVPEFTGTAEPYIGQDVCARGATSAEMGRGLERCGQVTDLDVTVHYDKQEKDANGRPIRVNGLPVYQIGPTVTDLITTDIPTLAGDSGGPLYEKDTLEAVGTLSGGNGDFPDTCGSPKAIPGNECYSPFSNFVPIAKGLSSYPGWRVSTAPRLRPSGSVVEPF
ncbi:S1 family peptidase, partial [Streptomyces sp. NPDC002187]|uniref:S1 family peptidase n=1 Tax=Streptomyces sp. NPDC002187 TaxID=3364637 RepID=UPI0036935327